ncbi:MAG: hypothetical protein RQ899_08625 [Pseudomonadales bacterium]|nr:hypothetical protein [Pseudomonadales bacterium]
MLRNSPDILFYPLAALWSLFYGAVAGMFFKLLAVYENWISINRLQLKLWKKYPQRSYRKYISNIWAAQIKGKPVEYAQYTRQQLEKDYPAEPFPILRLFINTLLMLLVVPPMVLTGLFDGPVYVYKKTIATRTSRQS